MVSTSLAYPPTGMYAEKTIAGKQVLLPWLSVESGNFGMLNAKEEANPFSSLAVPPV